MRPATIYLTVVCFGFALLVALAVSARQAQRRDAAGHDMRLELVRTLQLTDLCLVTEARYTRHPAMADLHAPFQDHPLALEHFPSGSLIAPPAILTRSHVPRP